MRIDLLGGKYTLVVEPDDFSGKFECLRYGKEWQDLTGNNMMVAVVYYIQDLQQRIDYLEGQLMDEITSRSFED